MSIASAPSQWVYMDPISIPPSLYHQSNGIWLLNNFSHLEIEVSWRAYVVGFVSRNCSLLAHVNLYMSYVYTFSIMHMTP